MRLSPSMTDQFKPGKTLIGEKSGFAVVPQSTLCMSQAPTPGGFLREGLDDRQGRNHVGLPEVHMLSPDALGIALSRFSSATTNSLSCCIAAMALLGRSCSQCLFPIKFLQHNTELFCY